MFECSGGLDTASPSADHYGKLCFIVESGRFGWPPDRLTVSDQTRREAPEDFGVGGLFEAAFLEVIVVVETHTEDLRRLGHRRQYPNRA